MNDFVFRDDIPLPNPRGKDKYPDWSKMKVHQSVIIEGLKYENIRSATQYAGRRHKMKFSVRKLIDGTIGVWREE